MQTFLDVNAPKLTGVVDTGIRKALDDSIVELADHESEQSGKALAARFETRKHHSLRATLLLRHLAPIARIAALELPHSAELLPLRMPKSNLSITRLAAAAYGMAKAAAPYSQVFIDAALPPDFIARLTTTAGAMMTAVSDRSQHRSNSKGATRAIRVRLSTARKTVRVLDALVRDALRDDPRLLEAWKSVQRIPASRTPAVEDAKPSATPHATPPATPPAAPEVAAT